jgi:glycosyltransferase involved in cell wall biosynthesis
MSKTDISVVICAYSEERWEAVTEAVESIKHQNITPLEIILVIDYNKALFERALKQFVGVNVVENVNLRGISGARNTAIAMAQGSILAFLDDDAAAESNWLEWLLKGYDDPQVLGIGGFIEPNWLTSRPGWFPEEFNWVVGCTYLGMPKTPTTIRNMIGANMSFRAEVLKKTGGFRDELARLGLTPFGCEETELCIKVLKQSPQGYFVYEPRAKVHHRVTAKRTEFRYFMAQCYSEGLAKAYISKLVGSSDVLSLEKEYTYRVLPRGVWRGIATFIQQRDIAAIGQSGAIVAGLVAAGVGYLVENLSLQGRVLQRKVVSQPANQDNFSENKV